MIKSCVPSIVNPWHKPSIDLDAILIAIRIATYGDTLEIDTKVPGTGEERKFDVDLRKLLNKMVTVDYLDVLNVENMKVELKPLTYKEFTDASLKTFEEQRIFSIVNDEEIPDTEKLAKFNVSFKKLTDLTVGTLSRSIVSISIGDDIVLIFLTSTNLLIMLMQIYLFQLLITSIYKKINLQLRLFLYGRQTKILLQVLLKLGKFQLRLINQIFSHKDLSVERT